MKENENLLKWSISIMTIPLSSVIFFFGKIYMSFIMGDDSSSVREGCIRDSNLVLPALRRLIS